MRWRRRLWIRWKWRHCLSAEWTETFSACNMQNTFQPFTHPRFISVSCLNSVCQLLHRFYRATLCQRSIHCRRVCLSVLLSVRPSQAGAVPKRLNVGSPKQPRTIAQGLYSFLTPKFSAKFQRRHPLQGAKQTLGGFKLAIIYQHLAISQKRCKFGT